MENREFWYSDTVLINFSSNSKISVTLYYGASRQYAIKTSEDLKGDETKQIKSILKKLREEKKNVTPSHGCTNYC